MNITDDQILEIIGQIERSTSNEGAVAKFRGFGEVALYANRQGFLRIGLEMLKCAVGESADLNDIFSEDSDFGIDHLVTNEDQLNFLCK